MLSSDLDPLKDGVTGPLAVVVSQSVEGSSLVASHSHVRGQLLGVWRGLLTLCTESGKWLVPKVHAVWIPPGQLHWASVHGQADAWSVYLRPDACMGLPAQPATLRISALLRETVRRLEGLDGEPTEAMRRLLEQVVVNEVASLPAEALDLPMPRLTHLPLITADNGQKLSKQNLAPALPEDANASRALLHHTLTLLGQAPPPELATASPAEQLAHATPRWSLAAVGTAPSLSAATAPMGRTAEGS